MRRLSVVLCLVGLLIAAAPALAQRTTGDIVGTVTDDTKAVLPGVTVTLVGTGEMGTFTTVTTASGFYRFLRLFPGPYDLTFAVDGFTTLTRTGVRVDLGATTTENVTMSVGAMTDEVTVVGDSVMVDATDTGMSNNFDNEMVSKLPTRRSSIYDLMLAAPGITSAMDNADGDIGHMLMSMGSETDSNSFQLDGISATSRSQGRIWIQPSPDIVDEVETIALGAPAEYGHVPGAVFNVITKQGSNTFHGDVSYYARTAGLTADNTDEEYDQGNPFNQDHFHDFTVGLGGPIVKDKLWFYAAYQNRRDTYSDAGANPDIPTNTPFWTLLGKINWQINPNHRIVAKYAYEDLLYEYPNNEFESPSRAIYYAQQSPTPSIAYTGVLSDTTMVEVRYGGFYSTLANFPLDPAAPRGESIYYNSAYGGLCAEGPCLYTGGSSFWYDLDERSTSISGSVTHYADDFLGGSHDFKFGVQYLRAGRPDAIVGYNDWFALYLDDYGDEYVFGYDYPTFAYSGVANGVAVYADDTFRVTDRLTLRLGLRWDHDWGSVGELPEIDANGDLTGGVYAPAIDNLFGWDTLSPRLGLTYALTEDGKTLLRLGYGRYTRGIVTMDFAGGPGNIATTPSSTFIGYYDPADFHAETLVGDGRGIEEGGGAEFNSVDPNIKATYTDQYVVGIDRELARNWGLALTYTHKRGHNHPAWQEVNGTYEPFEYTNEQTGLTNTLFDLTSNADERAFVLGSPDFMNTRINAFNATLTKRMSDRWQLVTQVTFLRNTGSLASNFTQNGWGRQDGGVAWRSFGKNPNDYVNIGGRLIGDMPISFKMQAVRRAAAQLPGGGQLLVPERRGLCTHGKGPGPGTGKVDHPAQGEGRRGPLGQPEHDGSAAPVDRQSGPASVAVALRRRVQHLQQRRTPVGVHHPGGLRVLREGRRHHPAPTCAAGREVAVLT